MLQYFLPPTLLHQVFLCLCDGDQHATFAWARAGGERSDAQDGRHEHIWSVDLSPPPLPSPSRLRVSCSLEAITMPDNSPQEDEGCRLAGLVRELLNCTVTSQYGLRFSPNSCAAHGREVGRKRVFKSLRGASLCCVWGPQHRFPYSFSRTKSATRF